MKYNRALFILLICASLFASSCSTVQSRIYSTYIEKYNGRDLDKEEQNVRAFLKMLMDGPEEFVITAYERTAILYQLKRSKLMTHSYYLIKNAKNSEIYTLSYYGTKLSFYSQGAWMLNSDFDLSSFLHFFSGSKFWDTKPIDVEIDTYETAKKVLQKLDSDITYYYRNHLKEKPGLDNCNTALWETITVKK